MVCHGGTSILYSMTLPFCGAWKMLVIVAHQQGRCHTAFNITSHSGTGVAAEESMQKASFNFAIMTRAILADVRLRIWQSLQSISNSGASFQAQSTVASHVFLACRLAPFALVLMRPRLCPSTAVSLCRVHCGSQLR